MNEDANLPKITKKQQEFVIEYVNNGNNATAAYKKVYQPENKQATWIWSEASKLVNNPKVTLWIRYYQENQKQVAKDEIRYTKLQHFNEVNDLLQIAMECTDKRGNPLIASAIKALELKAKVANIYEDEHNSEPTIINIIRSGADK